MCYSRTTTFAKNYLLSYRTNTNDLFITPSALALKPSVHSVLNIENLPCPMYAMSTLALHGCVYMLRHHVLRSRQHLSHVLKDRVLRRLSSPKYHKLKNEKDSCTNRCRLRPGSVRRSCNSKCYKRACHQVNTLTTFIMDLNFKVLKTHVPLVVPKLNLYLFPCQPKPRMPMFFSLSNCIK